LKNIFLFFVFILFTPLFIGAQNSLFEHYSNKQGIPSNTIQAIKITTDGQLWLATSKMVCRYTDNKIISVKTTSGEDVIDAIGFYSENQKLFLYTLSGKIYECQKKVLELFPISIDGQEEFANRIINKIIFENNQFYVSTVIGGGLYSIKNENLNFLFSKEDYIRKFSFFCLEISEEKFIYGSNNIFPANNKFIFQKINKNPLTINLSVKSGYSKSSFLKLEDNTFLFAKEHELIHFNDSSIIQRIFVEKSITALFQDSEAKIWIGLNSGGLLCIPSGKPSTQNIVYYLGSKNVSGIEEDKQGNIWIATMEDGLYMLPASPSISYNSSPLFSTVNNKKVEEVDKTFPVFHQPENISIIGKKIISTHQDKFDSIAPVIFISGVKINNRDTTLQNVYQLKHNLNNFKISFVSFLNNSPTALQYKYSINGNEWVYTSSQSVMYNALPPGEHTFVVYAMNDAGVWNKNPAQITFIIETPIWKASWFYLLIILLAILVLLFFIIFYQRKLKKEKEDKEETKKRIMQSELQALRAQMNPHFTFNTLSSIQNFINSKNSEEAVSYLSKFAKLMRSIMDNSKKPQILLKDELSALELYMQLEQLRLENKFEYKIIIENAVDINYEEIPPMLLQPYVENAIWHGITHKEGKGNIAINITKHGNILQCTINDNGIGRAASEKINNRKSKHKSHGMSITKERLEILNAMHKSPLSVEITDILNEKKEVAGTSVKIFIPIEN
jgi:sensor histidine kinase YesM